MQMPSAAMRSIEPCSEVCPALVHETLDLIAAKWSVPIFVALHEAAEPLRYAELQRRVGAITPKELAKHLRALEQAGLVVRRVHATVPPSVDYALTTLGLTLYPSLKSLALWAAQYGLTVQSNKAANQPPEPERKISYR